MNPGRGQSPDAWPFFVATFARYQLHSVDRRWSWRGRPHAASGRACRGGRL